MAQKLRENTERSDRMLVIGLDSATLDVIGPWVKEGKLPNLGSFFEQGATGELASVPNINSAPAWSSISTGKNPGKHGIFWFVEDDVGRYSYTYVNASFRTAKPVWELLSDAGKRVGVINVPISYPALPLNGFLIAGLDAPGTEAPDFCYPANLFPDLQKKLGRYTIEPGLPSLLKAGKRDEAVEVLSETIAQRMRYARHLITDEDWDFFFVVFTSLDAAQHFFWKYMDPGHFQVSLQEQEEYGGVIYDVHRMLDDCIGELMQLAGSRARVMVLSDHGMGPTDARNKLLPYWLESIGAQKFADSVGRPDPKSLKQLASRAAMGLLARTYRLVDRRFGRETKMRLASMFPRLRRSTEIFMQMGGIDWASTKAYANGKRSEIWINLKGRQARGIVEPGSEYDDLCTWLDGQLRGALDPITGEPYVERVFRRDEVYSGPWVDRSPDLIVRWSGRGWIDSMKFGERTGAEIKRSVKRQDPIIELGNGHHTLHGIVLLRGDGIKSKSHPNRATVYDIAPTLLYLMGEPVPADMDGRVLTEIIEPNLLAARPVEAVALETAVVGDRRVYDREDEEIIGDRLRGLGYVE